MVRTRKSKIRLLKGVELSPGDLVWCYQRHSPGEDQTIFSQRADVERFVGEQQIVVTEWFIDEAKTASAVEGRAAFERMLAASKASSPHVKAILAWDLSRFSRDYLEARFYSTDLRLRDYQIVSILEDMPTREMGMIFEALIIWKRWRELRAKATLTRRLGRSGGDLHNDRLWVLLFLRHGKAIGDEALDVQGDGLSGSLNALLDGLALGEAAGKSRDGDGVAALFRLWVENYGVTVSLHL